MHDQTPTPAPLAPERKQQITTWAKTLQGPLSGPAHVRTGQMLEELLAELDRTRAERDDAQGMAAAAEALWSNADDVLRSQILRAKAAEAVLRQAEDALANCYDVTDYPADGQSRADLALAAIRSLLNTPSHDPN